jgi:hypothetical protein
MKVLTTARTRRGGNGEGGRRRWRYIYTRMGWFVATDGDGIAGGRNGVDDKKSREGARCPLPVGVGTGRTRRRLSQGGMVWMARERWGTALFSPQHALEESTRPPCQGTIA